TKIIGEALGIEISKEEILNKEPFLFYPQNEQLPLALNDYVVFVVGASVKNKIYPQEHFLEIANILEEPIVVIWANEAEHAVALFLEENADNVTACPKLNLNQLKQLIAHSKLVIGGDTGPTHMAWALNVPSVTIFGNTPEYRNTYITPINKVVKSNTPVNPLKLDKSDFSIQEIKAESIVTLAKDLLNA
ncbi:MAG TPA: lipopolysaccharide heptosyltransferase I, partial [Campylobacterales bacterium]|nr:lipopolysaccharide heptosyltransferase I [Campylobacterales bacterium]